MRARIETRLGVAAALAALTALAAPATSAQQGPPAVQVDVALDHGVLHADTRQDAYLRVALRGAERGERARAPMNIAIVIDKSSSMQGEKIARAKDAALAALAELGPDDIVSVIAYDSTVQVLVPATKVADRATIRRGIDRLKAGGMTALFAGTAKGAAEVRKFFDRRRVNRLVLLSDGQANVGPSSPGELGRLGAALGREGIGVTTVGLGLGYNEDLMVELAERSGGQHAFVEHASELAGFFRRGFGSLAAIVAQEVTVEITFAEGLRPIRALGVDAEVIGDRLIARLSQLYAGQVDELLVAFEAGARPSGAHPIAAVKVSYIGMGDMKRGTAATATRSVTARFSEDRREVDASAHGDVMVAVVALLANEKNKLAVQLRDSGDRQAAEQTLRDNMAFLSQNADRFGSDVLRGLGESNRDDLDNLDGQRWQKQRKEMRKRQNKLRTRVYDFEAAEDLF